MNAREKRWVRDRMLDRLNGRLASSDRNRFERALRQNPSLRVELSRLRRDVAVFRLPEPAPARDEALHRVRKNALQAFSKAGPPSSAALRKRRVFNLAWAALGATAVILALGLGRLRPPAPSAIEARASLPNESARSIQVMLPSDDPDIQIYWTFVEPPAETGGMP